MSIGPTARSVLGAMLRDLLTLPWRLLTWPLRVARRRVAPEGPGHRSLLVQLVLDLLKMPWRLLTWPTRLVAGFREEEPTRAAGSHVARGLLMDVGRLPLRILGWPLRAVRALTPTGDRGVVGAGPWAAFKRLGSLEAWPLPEFVVTYVSGFRLRYLFGALPALLVGALAWVVAALPGWRSPGALEAAYLRSAQDAWRRQDWDDARLLYGKLTELNRAEPEHRYRLGLALERGGQTGAAGAVMRRLARMHDGGYVPARLWLVRSLIWRAQGRAKPRTLAIYRHLKAVLAVDPTNPEANQLLATFSRMTGDWAQAERQLEAALERRPEMTAALAAFYVAWSEHVAVEDRSRARRLHLKSIEAAGAAEGLLALSKGAQRDLHWRLTRAEMALLKGRFADAIAVLEPELGKQRGRTRRVIARIHATWGLDCLRRRDRPGAVEHFRAALAHDPTNDYPTGMLMHVATGDDAAAAEAARALEALLPTLPAWQRAFVAGTRAQIARRHDEARRQLERALQGAPRTHSALRNNLASCLLALKPPQLERALELADEAVRLKPARLEYRDTRAEILERLARWKPALEDLQALLRRRPDDRALHRRVAAVYDALRMPDEARLHRTRASAGSGGG